MKVAIVEVERERETVIGVRAVADDRVLFACTATGARGTALALIEAVAFCAREGHAIVSPARPASGLRAVTLPDGSQWLLSDAWLRGQSSREIVAHLVALRAALRAAVAGGAARVPAANHAGPTSSAVPSNEARL